MNKDVLKAIIALKQEEIPFDAIPRDVTIVTNDEEETIDESGHAINVIPAWKFLLRKDAM